MLPSICLILLLPTLICSVPDIYFVMSDDEDSFFNCPDQNNCLTFDEYVEETDYYFTRESIFVFLAGNHTLQNELSLERVSNITFRGGTGLTNADIVCKLTHNIMLTEVNNVTITGLTFLLHNYEHDRESAVFVENSGNVIFSKMLFHGSGDETKPLARALKSISSNITIRESQFEGNTGNEGGAIIASEKSYLTLERNVFTGNRAVILGGAISISDSTDSSMSSAFIVNTTFTNNSAVEYAGAINCESCSLALRGTNKFVRNYCQVHLSAGGGAVYILNGKLDLAGRAYFAYNRAPEGGAVYISTSRVQSNTEVLELSFYNNSEGALAIYYCKNVVLRNVIVNGNIGLMRSAVYLVSSSVYFTGNTLIANNIGGLGGAVQMLDESLLSFTGTSIFDRNSASAGGGIYSVTGKIELNCKAIFINNRADGDGGALYSSGTNITLEVASIFEHNCARRGGAMYLRDKTSLTLAFHNTLKILNNHAYDYGGGLYHEDSAIPTQCSLSDDAIESMRDLLPYCFLRYGFPPDKLNYFIADSFNNTAGKDGSVLYGGLLDKCRFIVSQSSNNNILILHPYDYLVKRNMPMQNGHSVVSSEPYRLCFCDGSESYDCKGTRARNVHRGQKFTVSLIALGQGNATVPTYVRAVMSNTAKLDLQQNFQILPRHCSNFTYNVYSKGDYEELLLYSSGPCHDTGLARAVVNVTLLPCPEGFTLRQEQCDCEERLSGLANCTISEEPSIITNTDSKLWMNGTYDKNGSYQGLILFSSCPAQNCKTEVVTVTLDNPDIQCDLNHSGVLCGECAATHSLMLGSSRCKKCSNIYLTLIIPFALIGIALTVFLTFFRLTVATGMINSVILYANIVQVNRKLFFPANQLNILTVFIAWMNLDFGLESCFFNGMDEYLQTWLQLVFPIYVWILISLIIFASRYSITVSKLIGSNPIAVLATLLLMSYTKILKIIVEVYSFVHLEYPNNKRVIVWLKDANVPYLESKHLLLTVVTTLILVLVFLPYTLFLLLGYKTYRFSGKKYFCWLRRLRPLLESYYAPYEIHTRYWTGFLLLVRCALYIVFSFNSLRGERKSLLAIIIAFTGITIAAWLSGKIYRRLSVNVIEASMYLNLIVLSAAILADLRSPALVYTLVGVMFATMIGIVAYHFHIRYFSKSVLWQKIEAR